MVGLQASVGVHIVVEADPGLAAKLSGGKHKAVDRLTSTKHFELKLTRSVRRHGHRLSMDAVATLATGGVDNPGPVDKPAAAILLPHAAATTSLKLLSQNAYEATTFAKLRRS
jgi:hypothetical protein